MSPRSPVPAGQKHGPEFYWQQAKRFGAAGFTAAQLHAATRGVSFITVRSYLDTLRRRGLVETIGSAPATATGRRPRFVYRVAKALPVAPPASGQRSPGERRGAVQRNLWTAMRALPRFVVSELAIVASTEEVTVSAGTADIYVRKLVKAGLVATLQPSRPARGTRGHTPGVFRLLPSASTGPEAPCIIGNRVFDPNLREFVGRPLDADREAPATAVSA